jgi:hypothetical protein
MENHVNEYSKALMLHLEHHQLLSTNAVASARESQILSKVMQDYSTRRTNRFQFSRRRGVVSRLARAANVKEMVAIKLSDSRFTPASFPGRRRQLPSH